MSTSTAAHGPLPKIPEGSGQLQLGALVFDNADLLDIMGPMRIFGEEANKLNIKINFISSTLEPIRTSQQVKITPDYTLDNAPKMDLFFIPGGSGTRTYANNEELLRKVTARVRESTWTMSVCTGAGVLAKTGLVDGYSMTTNKAVFEWPVSQGPNVHWVKRARWVQDGKFVSSSGVSAGIDAALFILSELTDMKNAEAVATEIEYSWHKIASEDPFADDYDPLPMDTPSCNNIGVEEVSGQERSQRESIGAPSPLFLGLDLSTQQLKAIALETDTESNDHSAVKTHSSFAVHFDSDLPHYHTQGGVTVQPQRDDATDLEERGVATTPVLMWVEALQHLFDKMKLAKFPFDRVRAISGAAQQHGSVYWSHEAQNAFQELQHPSGSPLTTLFKDAFTLYQSPIWQDTSTTSQCQELEVFLGAQDEKDAYASTKTSVRLRGTRRLAERTGSRAYERYTGSQILKIVQRMPEAYLATERISLVSSFLATILMAKYAAIDVADGSGMNLLDIETKTWDVQLAGFVSQGGANSQHYQRQGNRGSSLVEKLGEVDASGKEIQGRLSKWFVDRYGFSKDVNIVSFTGDNPATVMAMKAQPGDAIVSLGTSDTLLLYTDNHGSALKHVDDPKEADATLSIGYLCHPVDPHGYLMLYCAKNGSLAREKVRDLYAGGDWDLFSQYLQNGMQSDADSTAEDGTTSAIGFYFFDREIWPPVRGVSRFQDGKAVDEFSAQGSTKDQDESRNRMNILAICESQFLAMRLRSSQVGSESTSSSESMAPSGISRILATGGASSNKTLLQLLSNVFGVPVVSMGSDDQQGAGSAAWGAARKAFLYGRRPSSGESEDNTKGFGGAKESKDESGRHSTEAEAIMPDLTQTRRYVHQIPEFLQLEKLLLQAANI
ncbi:hypothetical protein BGZ67_005236 [Mortierella alpina]|nr:hypothetical protein BGZ67_005236 [Mortierella alpina]